MNWDLNLISALIGIATGALGYWLTTFCIQPILKYRCVRSQVLSNLIYYAQVVETEDLNDRMKNLHWEGILANRKSAADLNAAIEELPKFYVNTPPAKSRWLQVTAQSRINRPFGRSAIMFCGPY